MIGIIDTGGGLRGIYGAGVFDYCLDKDIQFDYCIGVSAGCANIMAYLGALQFVDYSFYTKWLMDRNMISLSNFIKKGSAIDMDLLGSELSEDGVIPLDFSVIEENPADFVIVTTESTTAKPRYFTKSDLKRDDYGPVYASASLPFVNKPYRIGDESFFDGGLSDPIPFRKAMDDGCDRIAVILTKPVDGSQDRRRDEAVARAMEGHWPAAAEALRNRADLYQSELDELLELEKDGRALILAPDEIGNMKTLTRDTEEMKELYRKGLVDAQVLNEWMR